MVSQVAWADDENGSDADLKTLLEPTVVISPTLYDGFVADRNKSSGGATLNATKNTCDLRSAALGAFADYLFEEEELKQKYDEKDRIKTFLVNKDAWKHKDRRGVFATSSREWREYSRALMASRTQIQLETSTGVTCFFDLLLASALVKPRFFFTTICFLNHTLFKQPSLLGYPSTHSLGENTIGHKISHAFAKPLPAECAGPQNFPFASLFHFSYVLCEY